MNILKPLLVAAVAIAACAVAPQLPAATPSAATTSNTQAHDNYQKHLNHAKQLLNDEQWKELTAEALELQQISKTLPPRDGGTEKRHNARLKELGLYAERLKAAARDENLAHATAHYSRLAACFKALVTDDAKARWVFNTF